jgi:Zn-dependent peptidase ImmA (M78 family)
MSLRPNPQALEWAVERSGVSRESIISTWPKFEQWVDGSWSPTIKQIRDFADRVHISVPALFSDSLPDLGLQIADFRTTDDHKMAAPSPELYDTVGTMMARQEWMRGYFISESYGQVGYIGSFSGKPLNEGTIVELVEALHELLGLNDDWAARERTVASALKTLKDSIERCGISVAINGVVNDNTSRALKVEEFRGFTLADSYAPLIFINGKDKKTAQMFTLIHELCHLAFSETGVSNPLDDDCVNSDQERFCNRVAADFLVPTASLLCEWDDDTRDAYARIESIAKRHKVNFVVVARKAHDEGILGDTEFFSCYRRYQDSVPSEVAQNGGGGDYFRNKQYKLGNVFADAIWTAVNSDYISYRDAYALSGMKGKSFVKYFSEMV